MLAECTRALLLCKQASLKSDAPRAFNEAKIQCATVDHMDGHLSDQKLWQEIGKRALYEGLVLSLLYRRSLLGVNLLRACRFFNACVPDWLSARRDLASCQRSCSTNNRPACNASEEQQHRISSCFGIKKHRSQLYSKV